MSPDVPLWPTNLKLYPLSGKGPGVDRYASHRGHLLGTGAFAPSDARLSTEMAKSRGRGGQPPTKTGREGGYATKVPGVKELAYAGHHLPRLGVAKDV